MDISIFGLGYVGAVSLACLARDGHRVIGVDIDDTKLRLIESGSSPIIEQGMPELMKEVVSSGRVTVTKDHNHAIAQSSISFICVGTPSLPGGGQDQTALIRLVEGIGGALREKADFHTIVIRSTVTPGTVKSSLIPLLEDVSGKRANEDFGVCFQPEFLRESTSIKDYDKPPFTIVGSESDQSLSTIEDLFSHLPCDFVATSIETAEVLKYCCNTFHALKATFANEIGRLCQAINVDSQDVMQLVCKDTQLNISPAYMRPGFAFGGSCLPKDLRALVKLSQSNDVEIPMLANVLNSNQQHLAHSLQLILDTGRKHVGLIGLSFKSGTDDLRESPLVSLAESLIGKGYQLQIYDPEVNVSKLIGANKSYIENVIPHISSLMEESIPKILDESEIIVLGLTDKDILAEIKSRIREDQRVLDLTGALTDSDIPGVYQGVCW